VKGVEEVIYAVDSEYLGASVEKVTGQFLYRVSEVVAGAVGGVLVVFIVKVQLRVNGGCCDCSRDAVDVCKQ